MLSVEALGFDASKVCRVDHVPLKCLMGTLAFAVSPFYTVRSVVSGDDDLVGSSSES